MASNNSLSLIQNVQFEHQRFIQIFTMKFKFIVLLKAYLHTLFHIMINILQKIQWLEKGTGKIDFTITGHHKKTNFLSL